MPGSGEINKRKDNKHRIKTLKVVTEEQKQRMAATAVNTR